MCFWQPYNEQVCWCYSPNRICSSPYYVLVILAILHTFSLYLVMIIIHLCYTTTHWRIRWWLVFVALEYFLIKVFPCLFLIDIMLMQSALLHLKIDNQQDLLYSPRNSAQCYVAAWMRGEFGGEWIHIYVWLSSFARYLKLLQHCWWAIPQDKIKGFF